MLRAEKILHSLDYPELAQQTFPLGLNRDLTVQQFNQEANAIVGSDPLYLADKLRKRSGRKPNFLSFGELCGRRYEIAIDASRSQLVHKGLRKHCRPASDGDERLHTVCGVYGTPTGSSLIHIDKYIAWKESDGSLLPARSSPTGRRSFRMEDGIALTP